MIELNIIIITILGYISRIPTINECINQSVNQSMVDGCSGRRVDHTILRPSPKKRILFFSVFTPKNEVIDEHEGVQY